MNTIIDWLTFAWQACAALAIAAVCLVITAACALCVVAIIGGFGRAWRGGVTVGARRSPLDPPYPDGWLPPPPSPPPPPPLPHPYTGGHV